MTTVRFGISKVRRKRESSFTDNTIANYHSKNKKKGTKKKETCRENLPDFEWPSGNTLTQNQCGLSDLPTRGVSLPLHKGWINTTMDIING